MSKKLNTLIDIWYDTAGLIKKYPHLLFPLTIVAFLEALWLEFLYFAPYTFLGTLILPPIRRFLGELALHYPVYLLILPRIFNLGQIFLYILIGGILTGVTVVLAEGANEGKTLSLQAAWKKIRGRWFALILAALFLTLLIRLVGTLPIAALRAGFAFAGRGWLRQALEFLTGALPYIHFLLGVLAQTFILFLIPLIVLDNRKFFPAIGKGLVLSGQHLLRVYALLLLPLICYSPIWYLKGNVNFLVRKTLYPESILILLAIGILATIVLDTYIAVSATLFFLRHKK